jgi:hypothetical protein
MAFYFLPNSGATRMPTLSAGADTHEHSTVRTWLIGRLMRGKGGRLGTAVRQLGFAALAISCAGCAAVIPDSKSSDDQSPTGRSGAAREMRDLTAAERSILADSLASSLNEPESAKFLWAKVPKAPVAPSFEYCGMVNVKNNRGSYDGMQPFLATITTWNGNITGGAIAAIDTGYREENREVIPRLCRQKGLNPYEAKELGRR